jgi:predicted GIY-YIG superfamily endonuclease
MAFTIYKVTCPEGRSYIGCTGKSVEERFRAHVSDPARWGTYRRGVTLGQAIRRFGRQRFAIVTLAVVERAEDAAAIETLMIERHATLAPGGYNFMRSNYSPRLWKSAA